MDLGVLPMDCSYEDMFKEITRKLYGTEDGLSTTSSAAANATSNTPPVTTTNSNMEQQQQRSSSNGQRYEEQQTLTPPFIKEEALTAFGLAALMQTSFPPAAMTGYTPQGHHYPHHLSGGSSVQTQSQSGQSQPHQNQLPITIPPAPQPSQQVAETIRHVDRYISSDDELHWTRSKIATYNPAQHTFKCSECDFDGFLARVAEHWIETHANLRVYQCPQCPYTSAWARCVRMHIAKQHNADAEIENDDIAVKVEQDEDHFNNATNNPSTSPIPSSLWKENTVLEEVTKYLQRLKTKAENIPNKVSTDFANAQPAVAAAHRERSSNIASSSEKRYSCSYCPYATDRRDLFTRHENIHKDEKPFHCYICRKQFNRADHVKKHFLRMHRDHPYDINKIRRSPPKNASGMSYYQKYSVGQASTSSGTTAGRQNQHANHSQVAAPQQTHFQQSQPHHLHPLQTPQHHLLQTPHYTLPIRTPQPKSYLLKQEQSQQQHQNGLPKKSSPNGNANNSNSPSKEQKEKRFSCGYCSWSGVDNWCLKRHLNTHIKPFVCALCDYKAARSERLATHVLKVHNKRSCNKCAFLADDQLSLTEHIHEHHPLEYRANTSRPNTLLRNVGLSCYQPALGTSFW